MKSVFISSYMMLNLIGFVMSTLLYVRDGLTWAIGLTMVATLGVLLYFGSLYAIFIPPRSKHKGLPILTSLLLITSGLAAGSSFVNDNWVTLGFSAFTGIGWLLFVFWYSKLDRNPSQAIQPGKLLPHMEFRAIDQSRWTTQELQGKAALLVFYRGSWCPLCMAQVREIAEGYQAFKDLKVEIFFISPQPVSFNQSLAEKWNVPVTFLQDENLAMSQKLGIFHRAGTPAGMQILGFKTDTVFPTVLGVDENGFIRISDQTDNYRIRISPAQLLEAFKTKVLSLNAA
jgi:peroxiredoxin